jgi:HNH endonuclease
LFQTPKTVKDRTNKIVYLTHLVTPISEDIIEDPLSPDHKWARQVKLIAKASPLHAIPNPGFLNFFLPNRGLTNPIHNITNTVGFTPAQTQILISNYFSKFLCNGIAFGVSPNDEASISAKEGARITRHVTQESLTRDGKLIELAKQRAYEMGNGKIKCECCEFDFVEAYGDLGDRFIECHHKIHLKAGERITDLKDLALVCSNCHRMLHRMPGTGSLEDIIQLKRLIKVKFNYKNY